MEEYYIKPNSSGRKINKPERYKSREISKGNQDKESENCMSVKESAESHLSVNIISATIIYSFLNYLAFHLELQK
jgi:hypothetical protein